MKKIVCIGGGAGASQILKGLRQFDFDLTGLIAVTDTGRSTGKIRIAADIPAPGDIRNALVNLSAADPFLKDLFQFRFRSPKLTDLDGMAFGNLFIAALSQMLNSFERAVYKTEEFLQVKGRIFPIMLSSTNIACEREDGSVDIGEVNVRAVGKSPIKKVFLEDESAQPHPKAIEAILQADLVTIGPGSLFTTVIACLLTPGLAQALAQTKGQVVYVANNTTQSGQTEKYSIASHLQTVAKYLEPRTIDICLVNNALPSSAQLKKLATEGLKFLSLTDQDKQLIKKNNVQIVEIDLLEVFDARRQLWNKQDTILHDPYKIAKAIKCLI